MDDISLSFAREIASRTGGELVSYFRHEFEDGMLGTAAFSDCRRFRYALSRTIGPGPIAVCLGLNPSKAGADVTDQTINKMIGFSRVFGWGGFIMLNAYAYIATDPKDLKAAGYPAGPSNDSHIRAALERSDGPVICAWGSNARKLARPAELRQLIADAGKKAMAFRLSKDGTPWHPLYLPYNIKLVEMP